MKIYFGQIYIEPGIDFPFSYHFQKSMSRMISSLSSQSPLFASTYGRDFALMFRISAKAKIKKIEIVGPALFKKTKDVEFTIFLPFDVINTHPKPHECAMHCLIDGVVTVLDSLEIDTKALQDQRASLIKNICADPKMFDKGSGD